jgi:hypothetical protein
VRPCLDPVLTAAEGFLLLWTLAAIACAIRRWLGSRCPYCRRWRAVVATEYLGMPGHRDYVRTRARCRYCTRVV